MTEHTVAKRVVSLRHDLGALDRRVGDLVESLELLDRDLGEVDEAARREMLNMLSDARLDLHAARDHIEALARYAAKFDL
ncbi:hypothetical protein [Rhodococcus zopfii]|uniref:hypothetical protein n=1 Tax=Rhodococcus zopfii TaxID=43772 RepID=UPI0035284C07